MQHDKLISESAKIFSTIFEEWSKKNPAPAGLQPVAHKQMGVPTRKSDVDKKGNPRRSRNKAWKKMSKDIEGAAKSGQEIEHGLEGSGDEAFRRLVRMKSKKLGVKHRERSLEPNKKLGSKRAREGLKSSDPDYKKATPQSKKDAKLAFPKDHGLPSNKISKEVERVINPGRRRSAEKKAKTAGQRGRKFIGAYGEGHWKKNK